MFAGGGVTKYKKGVKVEKLKEIFINHFEKFLIIGLVLAIVVTNCFILQKLAFLNFYYLPVLVAGYFLGRKQAILTSLLVICLVAFIAILDPASFWQRGSSLRLSLDLIIWGGFLILTAYVVGDLYAEKEKKIVELKQAYIGVVEILTKYLEASDRYTKGHSVRVADYATEIAIAMGLTRPEVENIRVAGLLHDIGKIEISTDLIQKAATLTQEEKQELDQHVERGVKLLNSVGSVLQEAIPIVLAHHTHFIEEISPSGNGGTPKSKVPLGARIIAVADAYDAMVTDRPYRAGKQPWQAIQELEKYAGTQFDPGVVEAFKRVISKRVEES